jgi:hypothetical protein
MSDIKSALSDLNIPFQSTTPVTSGTIPTASITPVNLEFRESLRNYYCQSIQQKKYVHLTEELMVELWEMIQDRRSAAFLGKYPGIKISDSIKVDRSWTSEVQNRSESNSDDLQLPEKQTTPRGPKQDPPGTLR